MSQNNNSSSNLESNLWPDSLLVKDDGGHIHPWHETNINPGTDLILAPVLQPAKVPINDKFLTITKIGNAKSPAVHAFHPDDEEEIKKMLVNLPTDNSKKYSLEKIIDKLISKHNLHLSPEHYQLFSDIFFDFFRNRKNAIVVREDLSRKITTDKNVLAEELIDVLVGVAKVIKENINKSAGLVVKEADLLKIKDVLPPPILDPEARIRGKADPPLAEELASLEKELNNELDKKSEATQIEIENILHDLQPSKDKIQPKTVTTDMKVEPKIEAKVPETEQIQVSLPKVTRSNQAEASKKTVMDVLPKVPVVPVAQTPVAEESFVAPVKAPINLTGPVEELATMTLQNFRRLAPGPAQQAEKILAKISLLEKDSITKKAQGIEAWRSSTVYRLYLSLGEESLKTAKNITTIIQEKQKINQETLSAEEFAAISDLNKNLRF